MQNFLCSLRSPALFNNIFQSLPVAYGEGKFDIKMQDF